MKSTLYQYFTWIIDIELTSCILNVGYRYFTWIICHIPHHQDNLFASMQNIACEGKGEVGTADAEGAEPVDDPMIIRSQ